MDSLAQGQILLKKHLSESSITVIQYHSLDFFTQFPSQDTTHMIHPKRHKVGPDHVEGVEARNLTGIIGFLLKSSCGGTLAKYIKFPLTGIRVRYVYRQAFYRIKLKVVPFK